MTPLSTPDGLQILMVMLAHVEDGDSVLNILDQGTIFF